MKTMRRLLSRVGIINTGSGFFGLRVPYGWLYVGRRRWAERTLQEDTDHEGAPLGEAEGRV